MIHPARFLFNAGGTPKAWNEKMLQDDHLKVMMFSQNSGDVFSNIDITGGVAVTYRDESKAFGAIGVFTPYKELNSILQKTDRISNESLESIVSNRGLYRYSDDAYSEQPNEMKKTADRRIAPSSFERMPSLFKAKEPKGEDEYIKIYGNIDGKRTCRWFKKRYVKNIPNILKYKVLVPKANGSGAIGEKGTTIVIGTPFIAEPNSGFTETYISIGETNTRNECENILKYVKSKYARAMLGILKVTQNNAKPTWAKVPLQDFTEKSDINWNTSIVNIDKQLYKKYGLSQDEIDFIETHVKEICRRENVQTHNTR